MTAKTSSERQKARRERLRLASARQIVITLDKGAFEALAHLCQETGVSYSEAVSSLLLPKAAPLKHVPPKEAKANSKAKAKADKAARQAEKERLEELRLKAKIAEAGQLLPDPKPMARDEDGTFRAVTGHE